MDNEKCKFTDMTGWKMSEHGVKDSRWTVISLDHEETKVFSSGAKKKFRYWLCECSCEKHTQRIIRDSALRLGVPISCGCAARQIRNTFTLSKDELYKEYVINNLSRREIANKFGTKIGKINALLKKYNIHKDSEKASLTRSRVQTTFSTEQVERIKELYLKQNLTTVEVAQKMGLTRSLVANIVIKHHLEKTQSQKNLARLGEKAYSEQVFSREELYSLYIVDGLSISQVAQKLKTNSATVSRWLKHFGIKKTRGQIEECRLKINYIERKTRTYKNNKLQELVNEGMESELAILRLYPEKYSEYAKQGFFKGKTNVEIAEMLHCSYSYIQARNKRLCLRGNFSFSPEVSAPERELGEWFGKQTWLSAELRRHHRLSNGREVDFFFPELHLGIEYNGSFYHSEYMVNALYHQCDKSQAAQKDGIDLFHIFGYCWNNSAMKQQILQTIKNALYARIFPSAQGEPLYYCEKDQENFKIRINLAEQTRYIACTLRQDTGARWSIVNLEYNIISAKLFKTMIEQFKTQNGISSMEICSVMKIGEQDEALYIACDFEQLSIEAPEFVWFRSETKWSYPTNEDNEEKIWHKKGYAKVYDAGSKIWRLKI